jgi:hypothetical protein
MSSEPDAVTTDQARELLRYKSTRSILRLVKAGFLKPLPFPRKPMHFKRVDVMCLREGKPIPVVID